MFEEILQECARNLGEPPRSFSTWDRLNYWRIVRPDWLYQNPNDELETFFLKFVEARRIGKVVWGHFIQANNLLYSPGKDDCPAEIVYSLDETEYVGPEELGEVAAATGRLKNTTPDEPKSAEIANYLTNEWIRVFGVEVPKSIALIHRCNISTIYVVRKHLPAPGHFIEKPFLPIIVDPNAYVALILPSRYWPESLVEWWVSE